MASIYDSAAIHRIVQFVQANPGHVPCQDDIDQIISDVNKFWTFDQDVITDFSGFMRKVVEDVGLDADEDLSSTIERVQERHGQKLQSLGQLIQSPPTWEIILKKVSDFFQHMKGVIAMVIPVTDSDMDNVGIAANNGAPEMKAQDLLLRGVMNHWNSLNLARRGDSLYQPLFKTDQNGTRFFTRTYKEFGEIKTTIYNACGQMITQPELYELSIQASVTTGLEKLVKRVLNTPELEGVPVYNPDRTLFSFRDGVLDVKNPVTFRSYDMLEFGVQTSNYFDMDIGHLFGMGTSLESLDTPAFDHVLQTQGIYPGTDLYRIFCAVCIGRMCFDINTPESDNWQIVPMIVGQAGGGKSTLCEEVIYKIYGYEQCGIIPDKITTAYMGYAFENKLLWACSEVTERCTWNQSLFQQIVSGEMFASERKYHDLKSVRATFPGIMMSNTGLGAFEDKMGSLARRVVPFFFSTAVPPSQQRPELIDQIRDEFANILIKGVVHYHWLRSNVVQHGAKRLWKFLHLTDKDYFERGKLKTLSRGNVLMEFLYESIHNHPKKIAVDPANASNNSTYYIKFDDFKDMAEEWCEATHRSKPQWSHDEMEGALGVLGAVYKADKELLWPPRQDSGVLTQGNWICGLAKIEHAKWNTVLWTSYQPKVVVHFIGIATGTNQCFTESHCEIGDAALIRTLKAGPPVVYESNVEFHDTCLEIVLNQREDVTCHNGHPTTVPEITKVIMYTRD